MKHCSIVTLVLLIISAAGAQEFRIYPRQAPGYEVKDNKIYFRRGNAGLILEYADSESISRYYKERGLELGNPFREIGGELQDATIFLVTLLNRTNGNLTFTPRYVTMKIKTEASFPLDFTILLGLLEKVDTPIRKVLYKSIFHSPEMLTPDKVVSKFLIFPATPKRSLEMKLEFDYLYFEDQEIRTNFFFVKEKIKKKQS